MTRHDTVPLICIAVIITIVAGCFSTVARADQGFTYAQISCMAKTDYLTLETRFIEDIDPKGFRSKSDEVEVAGPEWLEKHPFVCTIKGHTIGITADTARIAGPLESCQSQLGGYNVRVDLDGRRVDTLRQVDCDNRRYFFDILVDSDFPTPATTHYIFFEHCIADDHESDYRASEPSTVDSFSAEMSCATKSFEPTAPGMTHEPLRHPSPRQFHN